jgi:flagellar hook-associated protein 2
MGVNGIYGLSGSGLDIESLVRVGMMGKQSNYDKMYKSETKQTWEKEAYSTIYSDINKYNLTTLSKYKLQSNLAAMKATSSDSAAITVSANGAAAAMSHTVSVTGTSSNAYMLSAKPVTDADGNKTTSLYLKDSIFGKDTTVAASRIKYDSDGYDNEYTSLVRDDTTGSITLTAADGGKTVVSEADASKIKVLEYTIKNTKDNTTQKVSADDTAVSFKLSDGVTEFEADAELGTKTKDKEFKYTYADIIGNGSKSEKTFNDMAADMRNAGMNIQATYDSANNSFSLYNSNSGEANTISLTMGTDTKSALDANATVANYASNLFGHLNLEQSQAGSLTALDFKKGETTSVKGTSGRVKIDGVEYNNVKDNKITVSGVTYTILGKTTDPVNVAVSQDTDSIVSTVKSFVDDYNKMIDELNDKYYEKKYSDYQPLTKSQEDSMKEDKVTKWNEKAKSGILYHSNYLNDIIYGMRDALSTPVSDTGGKYNSAYALGITTSTDKGHITLDEDKLKKALAAEPDCVYKVFGSQSDANASEGVSNRIADVMHKGLKSIKSYAGTSVTSDDSSTLGTHIRNMLTKMSDFKETMDAYEDKLYDKYDNMEVALQQLTSQLSYISSITNGNS